MKYSFANDYSLIAHPKVLNKMLEISQEQNIGYGLDKHTARAKELISKYINKKVDIYFLAGGTQTNLVVISHLLKGYEAVITVESGHINVHETGAVEGTGHKILTVKGINGKILPSEIEEVVNMHSDMHMVKPKLVYISNTTEVGSVYSRAELIEISMVCKKYNLYLFLDGARLSSALAASDMTLDDLATYTDVFYIGGTKNGLCYGEAVVFGNRNLANNFDYHIKNKGALLSKGFACALGFEVLFDDGLFFLLGKNANECALNLAAGLKQLGYKLYYKEESNQIFVIMNDSEVDYIKKEYLIEIFGKCELGLIVRFVTSFDTDFLIIEEFLTYLELQKSHKN